MGTATFFERRQRDWDRSGPKKVAVPIFDVPIFDRPKANGPGPLAETQPVFIRSPVKAPDYFIGAYCAPPQQLPPMW